jgi:tripartite-type tricarboxylate transporter receptor subunit TctC
LFLNLSEILMPMRLPQTPRRLALASLAALPLVLAPLGAAAQASDWPARPVTWVNPFAAGSAVDVVARIVAQKVAANTGQGMNVDNRTGASGNIGTDFAARAKADGYTLLLGSPGTMAINPFLFAKLPYDAVKDFTPITQLVSFPQVVVTSPKQNFKTVPELIAAAKAQPDKLAHASSGAGSTSHLVMELIKADAGIKLTHVGYRGGAPAMQAVMAGDVQAGVEGLPSLVGQIKAGAIVPLAVTSLKRSPQLPQVPAMSEFIPGFDATAWIILMAPAGTPAAVVTRIQAEVKKALDDPGVRQQLEAQGATVVGSNPSETQAFHRSEMTKFKRAVEISGAKAE